MSDQDFFFDDEPETKTASKKGAAQKGGTAKAKPSQAKNAPARTGGSKPAPKGKAQEAVVDGETSFTLSVVILIAIIALLVGLIGGVLIGKSLSPGVVYTQEDTGTAAPGGMGGMGSGGTAPTLSDEQIQGGMPSGHPPLDEGSAESTATPGGK